MKLDLSVIVPLYNEEESVPLLYEKIVEAVSGLNLKYEIIFVDDGSRDNTFQIASDIAKKDNNLKVVKFRGNYGQTPAMAAGIDLAVGTILVTMDGDLQNDPSDIPNFLTKIKEGYDIVVGWRFNRQDKLITRKIPSQIANWIIGKVTGVPIKDNGCSLKAYKAEVIKSIPFYSEMHRFIPAMTSITGAKVAEIKVKHHARQFGESKYGLSRIYKVVVDLLTIKTIVSFSSKSLLWFTLLMLPSAIISSLFLALSVYNLFSGSVSIVVELGTSVLFGSLAAFTFILGILSELVFKTGNISFKNFAKINKID